MCSGFHQRKENRKFVRLLANHQLWKEENNINRLEKNLQKENDENVRGVINETDDKNTLKKNKSKLFWITRKRSHSLCQRRLLPKKKSFFMSEGNNHRQKLFYKSVSNFTNKLVKQLLSMTVFLLNDRSPTLAFELS